ncbi:MAG: Peptidase C60 sortase A and B [Candidatus Daviesbacteria bacterium GW2011_GWA2_38_24]|uniref:Peptidase C60 sortase A and B n=1 Tax=Candidatus Daviesbacteria bacterium GW2011_GWA2_38_24 TaxID=1618422 RepID=A0A0G0JJ02_9BACT|nr:MAG: Peptidase C60 sortase A and B [Candidatus Daviesbacteria bacterium GW2011_GWA2_38_24]KKQ80431.1 MAG: Peptidase C60 sortase A and B [Candidatus Daviesbacteria bacterium GW2011_GWA1_38_7]OGE22600.1 MAG: hypothetical protein A2688_04595 [Candidatus Daviesbacteria bacterium RIFCSPHIGHO2_01_FULL_38_8]
MKKAVILVSSIITGVVLAVSFLSATPKTSQPVVDAQNKQVEVAEPAKQELSLILENPTLLEIPSLGIKSNIEHVGLDSVGNMDVPKRAEDVAWYSKGYKIGQEGNAVIAGHFDTTAGTPAVFYNLEKLFVGDEIRVQGDGKTVKFRVTGKQVYSSENFPLEVVFGDNPKSSLNLITCEGVFNSVTKNYSHRTVIFSELVES